MLLRWLWLVVAGSAGELELVELGAWNRENPWSRKRKK
jgi:hypothetical protein